MSDNTYSGIPSREEIQSMSTPELMEILRQESYKSSDSASDAELIFYILEVLETREDAQESTPKQNPKEAYEKFQKLYLDPGEDGISIRKAKDLQRNEKLQVVRFPKWLRSIAAVAAVLAVVVIVGSVTIKAVGLDPWTLFANWTKDIFYFSNGETQPPQMPEPDVAVLEDMLEKHSVTIPAVPHWLPEGYELFDVYEHVSPFEATITAEFWHEMECFMYTLQISSDASTNASTNGISEKDENDVEIYEYNNQVHYIFSNNGNMTASWTVENCVFTLYGPITMENMKLIIASFYEGN